MAPRLKCNLCEQPLVGHCPDTNAVCTWLRCTSPACSADLYDWRLGTLRHTDGRVEAWGEQPEVEGPPAVDITDDTDDGRPATPDA